MKKTLILISLTLFYFGNALAVTLYDALNQTYRRCYKFSYSTKVIYNELAGRRHFRKYNGYVCL